MQGSTVNGVSTAHNQPGYQKKAIHLLRESLSMQIVILITRILSQVRVKRSRPLGIGKRDPFSVKSVLYNPCFVHHVLGRVPDWEQDLYFHATVPLAAYYKI